MKRLQLACVSLLFLFLTSCGVLSQVPPDQAIRLAIAQQQTNIRREISDGLGLPSASPTTFKIDKLSVTNRQKLTAPKLSKPGYPDSFYKVRGTFLATLATTNQTIQQESPFEIYLGTNAQGKGDRSSKTDKNKADKDKVQTWYWVPSDLFNQP